MEIELTNEEKENLRVSEIMDKKTSEIIDMIHTEEDDVILNALLEEVGERYPVTSIDSLRKEFEDFQNKINKRLDKVEERLSKIDNHYLIINKLEKIMDILKKKQKQ